MAYELNCQFLTAEKFTWALRGAAKQGPAPLSGMPQMTLLDGGGWWEASLSNILATAADKIRYLDVVQALADGGAGELVVPYFGKRTAPWPVVAGAQVTASGTIPFSDGTLFSDGTAFAQPVIVAQLGTPAALRATSIVLQIVYGSDLRGGEMFSVQHPTKGWRAYRVRSAVKDPNTGNFTCDIRPAWREASGAATALEFDRPRCSMVMKAATGLDVERTRLGSAAIAAAVFVES